MGNRIVELLSFEGQLDLLTQVVVVDLGGSIGRANGGEATLDFAKEGSGVGTAIAVGHHAPSLEEAQDGLLLDEAAPSADARPGGRFAEEDMEKVVDVLRGRVGLRAVGIACQAVKSGGRHQRSNGHFGQGTDEGFGRSAQARNVVFGNHPSGLGEYIGINPSEGTLLAFARHGGVDSAGLLYALILVVNATDVASDVSDVAAELSEHTAIHLFKIGAEIAFFIGPLREMLDDVAEIFQPVSARFHGVVAEVFGLRARVVVGAFAAKPKSAIAGDAVVGDAIEGEALFLLTLRIGEILVAPFDGPHIVVVDAGKHSGIADVIFRLSNVIEARIVHDGGSVAVLFDPSLVAKVFHGSGTAGPHVVAQTEGVSHLVRGNKANELPHEFVVKQHLASTLVDGTGLHQSCTNFITLWYQPMWLSKISPLRGSWICGP